MRQRSSGSIGGSLSPCSVIVGYCWYEQLVVLALVTFVVVTGVICRPTHTHAHTHTHTHTCTHLRAHPVRGHPQPALS